jgi:hypothetical protein
MLSLQFRPRLSYAIFEGMLMLAIFARVANIIARHRARSYADAVYDFELGRYERCKGRSAENVHYIHSFATRSTDGEAGGDNAAVKHTLPSMRLDDKSIEG